MPEQNLGNLLSAVIENGVSLQWTSQLGVFLVALVGGGVGAFLVSYLKEKGRNFATKEDFEQLLSQEKKTTKELENIRGEISTGVWIEQRRWDLKRDTYTRLLEVFHELRRSTRYVAETYDPNGDKAFIERNKEFYDKHKKRQIDLIEEAGQLTAVGALMIELTALTAIDQFQGETTILHSEEDSFRYMSSLARSGEKVYAILLSAARQDLLGRSRTNDT